MKRIYGTAIGLALGVCAAWAQDAAADKAKLDLKLAMEKMQAQRVQILGLEGAVMSNVKGAPYSAEQISETTQTLGDGTRIHRESSVKLYRDGAGRVRRETPDGISILDPVAGVGYTLNPKTMTGSKMQVTVNSTPNSFTFTATESGPDGKSVRTVSRSASVNDNSTPVGSGRGAGSGAGGGSGAGATQAYAFFTNDGPRALLYKANAGKVEDLGYQSMEGVAAHGERRTNTIDAGEIGNDRPIQTVEERWYSNELQMEIMTRHSDPRTGEETVRLSNIRRGEPDAALFQPPAGYQIREGNMTALRKAVTVKEQ